MEFLIVWYCYHAIDGRIFKAWSEYFDGDLVKLDKHLNKVMKEKNKDAGVTVTVPYQIISLPRNQ